MEKKNARACKRSQCQCLKKLCVQDSIKLQSDQKSNGDGMLVIGSDNPWYKEFKSQDALPHASILCLGPGESGAGSRICLGDNYSPPVSSIPNVHVAELGWETNTDTDALELYGREGVHVRTRNADFSDVVTALVVERTATTSSTPSFNIEATRLNVKNLPKSPVGLLQGDLYVDTNTGTVKFVL